MTLATLALIGLAGAAAGLLVGLIGVGGGILYAPVLLVLLRGSGVEDPVLTPLVAGTSLLCVLLAALAGTRTLVARGGVDLRLAARVGAAAAVPVVLTTALVATQPWYRERTFAAVLGVILVMTAVRLVLRRNASDAVPDPGAPASPPAAWRLGVAGAAAGVLSALAGVGGGVVMVPALAGVARLPFKAATATSAAAIVPIALVGVVSYAAMGWGADLPAGAVGYVAVPQGLALALPAMVTARLGVILAERLPARTVRLGFAAFAGVIAARLLWHALGG